MTRPGRGTRLAALASLPVLPLAWFLALRDVPIWMSAAYLGYLLIVIAIPGTLFWRRLTGGTGWFAVDAVLGTTFGLAVEALLYPLGRWVDIPLIVLVMPALASGMYRGLPRRRLPDRLTPWWAIAGVMVSVGVAAAWFVRVGSRLIPLDGPAALRPDSDSQYNLSVAAELTHHFAPQIPYASGRPLTSHWGAFSHLASAHWTTSIELDVLLFRIVPFAMLLLTVLAAAAVGMMLTGRAVAAPIAAGLTIAAGDLAGWPWTISGRLYNDSPFSLGQLTSPSQAFSAVLVLPLIAVTALLLRRKPGQTRLQLAGLFVAAGILIAALAATKASALPVYAAGLAAAWIYLTVRAGRLNLRALVLAAAVAASYLFVFFVALRRTPSNVTFEPAKTFRHMLDEMSTERTTAALVVVAVVVAIGWLMPAAGALLIRRRLPRDPMVVMLLFSLLSAVVATGLLYDDGQAQLFFVRSGFIYGVLIATWGLSSLDRRQYYAAAPALLIGVAAIYWGRYRSEGSCGGPDCLAQPMAVALVTAAVGVGVLGLIVRGARRTWAVIAVAAALGMTVSPTVASLHEFAAPPLTAYESVAPGGIEAARFIRRNSGPSDLIATNLHCRDAGAEKCLTGSYWIPGYAERRVLVEGWAYTTRVDDTYTKDERVQGAFWDQEMRRLNDEAFTAPTREILETLRTKYGVQWLLADKRVAEPSEDLERLTELRFEYGTVRVYQLYPPPTGSATSTPGGFPSGSPSGTPSQSPSGFPSQAPSGFPSASPSQSEGAFPTQTPGIPSQTPTSGSF